MVFCNVLRYLICLSIKLNVVKNVEKFIFVCLFDLCHLCMCFESDRCFTKLISVKSAKLYTLSLRILLVLNLIKKDQSLYSDGKKFHRLKKNEQLPLTSNDSTQTKTKTYGIFKLFSWYWKLNYWY